MSLVSPNYFATLGIPVLAGRDFELWDAGAIKRAIINQTFAKQYFPGRNPIGFHIGEIDYESPTQSKPDHEIIGVIKDTKFRDLREANRAQAYFPYLQDGSHVRFMTIYLRTQSDPRQVIDQVREQMRRFDPNVPVVGLRTVGDQLDMSLKTERLVASLAGVFGGLATLLSVIGLYGVMAYTVTRRTREMGIRMALGATRGNVVRMVMREAAILVIAGLLAGASLSLISANLIRNQLFGLSPDDPWTLMNAIFSLCIAALICNGKSASVQESANSCFSIDDPGQTTHPRPNWSWDCLN
jgi:hypothetical protein